MQRAKKLLSLTLGLLLFTLVPITVRAAALQPTSLSDAGKVDYQEQSQPVVHVILFWMDGCPHCHEVLDNVLPPLQEKYGSQLEILLVEVVGLDDVNRLYDIAATYGFSRDQVGVPFLIIGDQALAGSQQIPAEMPGLIEQFLAKGGVDRPSIPKLDEFTSKTTQAPMSSAATGGALVRATLFTTLDCRACQLEVSAVLKPLQEKYGEKLEVRTVDILTAEDVEYLYQVGEAHGVPRDDVDLPLIIIGEHVLIDEQMAVELPELVAAYLAAGGADWPSIPARQDTVMPSDPETTSSAITHSDGFTLAIVIMALMAAALLYSLIALWRGAAFSLPPWADWLIPALIVIGVGVAGYLSYVETQAVEAICGPVGDCNTVQQSRYAKLFDILPVGVLGLLGYLGLIAAWLARRFLPRLEKLAAISFWGMAFFAVIFSLYLTYLEPFVIKAVCIWCLTSAVIVTLLLLLGTPPAVLQFATSNENE